MKGVMQIASGVVMLTLISAAPRAQGRALSPIFNAAARAAPTPAPPPVVVRPAPPATITTTLPRQIVSAPSLAPVLPAAAVARSSPVASTAVRAFDDAAARHAQRITVDRASTAAQASIINRTPVAAATVAALSPARRSAVSAASAAAKTDGVATAAFQKVHLAPALPPPMVSASGAVGSTAGLKAAQAALGRAANGVVSGKAAEAIGLALYQTRQRLAAATTMQVRNITQKRIFQNKRLLAKRLAQRRFDEKRRLALHYNLSAGEGRTILVKRTGRRGPSQQWTNTSHALADHGPDANTFDQVALRGKRVATKFTDRAVMEEAIERTMIAKKPDIDVWAKTAAAGQRGNFSHAVKLGNLGTGHYADPLFYETGAAMSKRAAEQYRRTTMMRPLVIKRALKTAKVVLISDGKGGYHLQSAYPE